MFSPFKSFFERLNGHIVGDAVAAALISQSMPATGFTYRFDFPGAFFDPAGFYFVPVRFFRAGVPRVERDAVAVFEFDAAQSTPKIHAFITPSEPRFSDFATRFKFFSDFFASPSQRLARSA